MVTLQLILPPLDEGRMHISTWYQIAKENTFDTIVLNIEDDTVNLLSVKANVELEDGVTYYARTKFATDPGGLSAWSTFFTFVAGDTNEFNIFYNHPTLIEVPKIYSIFDRDGHPEALFEIILDTDYLFDYNSYIKANWLIEDINGKVVFSSLDDEVNLKRIYFNGYLEPGVYVMKLSIETASGDVSDFGSYIINVNKINNIFYLKDYLTLMSGGVPISLVTNIPGGYESTDIKVFNYNALIDEFTVTNANIDLIDKIPDDFHTTIALRANYIDGTKSNWIYKYVINDSTAALPSTIPYELH